MLMQSEINDLLTKIGDFPPCVVYSLQQVKAMIPAVQLALTMCVTVSGSPIIFNARPGHSPSESLVRGYGAEATVVPKVGGFTSYQVAAKISPAELKISREDLPKKYQQLMELADIAHQEKPRYRQVAS